MNLKPILATLAVPLVIASFALAQIKPPVIPDKLRGDFFKAQAEAVNAQAQAQQAAKAAQDKQQALQALVTKMQDTCGKNFVLQGDKDNEPVCVAKPADPKK